MKILTHSSAGRWAVPMLVGIALTFGVFASAQSAPALQGIILVDRNAIMNESAAGQEIVRQVQDMRKKIEDDLKKKADTLRVQEQQLASQQSLLTQDAFEQKARVLRDQQVALQREADEKSRQLQNGYLTASNTIWQAASPILDALLKEKQATLMLERTAVVKGSVDLDVTAIALQRLNEKLPTVKVTLVGAQAASAAPAAAAKATP